MRQSYGVAIAAAASLIAIVVPVLISVELSWREGLANESSLTLSYARDVMHRSHEQVQQMRTAISELESAHYPPCSPPDVDLMRQIDLDSSYIQAVGRIQGNRIVCTSLGTTQPFDVGPPGLTTENYATERLIAHSPIGGDHPLLLVSKDGIAFFLEGSLTTDTPTEGPKIGMAVFVPSSPNHTILVARNDNLKPEWFRPIAKGGVITFRNSGYVVALVRSADSDVEVIAAAPESYTVKRVQHFAAIFVPLGLVCAALLAWAVTHIARIQFSLPSVLRSAAKRKEFYVEYQPIVDLATRRWVGAEALVRWRRSGSRIVRPDSFIPIAEESGVITLITQCVADIVAADLPKLIDIDPDFWVAINLSAPDLRSPGTVDMLKRILDESRAKPRNLKVEATERGFLQGKETHAILAAIRDLHIWTAIDDFGTGYSSLSCLQTLGLDSLKIDKSFVDSVGTDGATSNVVPHIISMAHSLKLVMVAEGVETEAQARFLERRSVHYAQGWLFGKPMRIDALYAGLKSQPKRQVAVSMQPNVFGVSD